MARQELTLAELARTLGKKTVEIEILQATRDEVRERPQGATIRGFTEEKENGYLLWVEKIVGGHTKDRLIDASGAVVEIEQQVALNSLPAPVRAALIARVSRARIMSVESITKQGRLVAYEAQVEIGRKRLEIQVGPDGKPLAQEQ